MNLVVVESPAKAKTINKFLGMDFKVLASYGHVRDIEEKKGIDVNENFKINYQKDKQHSKHLSEIKNSLKKVSKLYLATDQDREGEAIAWHIKTILEDENLLNNIEVFRITFNEITKRAVLESLELPRDIDMNMVNAYQARRSLDYLMGFSLSPLLIRKLPGCKSAGRVQSVALKLITERENEITKFVPTEYWSIPTTISFKDEEEIEAKIHEIDGNKIGKLDIKSKKDADKYLNRLVNGKFIVENIEIKNRKNKPYPPFITSSLQLDASNKLGFSPSRTMSLAQKLYEGIDINGENKGLITYMRTDSTNLSSVFINDAKKIISIEYGENYVYTSARTFQNKVKNTQEAHEAIRPSDPSIKPSDLPAKIEQDLKKLYNLIWRRSLATQAMDSISEIISIKVVNEEKNIILSSSATQIKFDGYKKIYQESELVENQKNLQLNNLTKGLNVKKITADKKQHFTEPPPRFTEVSLIKKLEDFGIGRPSTYANIMKKNQLRGYVKLEAKRFFPQPSGRIVTCFLENYFKKYLDYNFTAEKEDELDLVSKGDKNWKDLLHEFWTDFSNSVNNTLKLSNTEVYDYINIAMEQYLFPNKIVSKEQVKSNLCPKCKTADLSIKMRKNGSGPFVACTSHPKCDYIRSDVFPNEESQETLIEDRVLGKGENNMDIILKKGPYGPYVQLGNNDEEKSKIKRASVPKNIEINTIDLQIAEKLLALPREVGKHPESGKLIIANNGRYGPYLKYDNAFYSIPKDEGPLTIGINRAVDIIAKPKKRTAITNKPIKVLGKHSSDNNEISLYKGRFGFYLKYNNLNYSIPKSLDADNIKIEEAIKIIEKKNKRTS